MVIARIEPAGARRCLTWATIERLYHEALGRAEGERAAVPRTRMPTATRSPEVQSPESRRVGRRFFETPAAWNGSAPMGNANPVLDGPSTRRLRGASASAPAAWACISGDRHQSQLPGRDQVSRRDLADPGARRRFQTRSANGFLAQSPAHPHVHDAGEFEGRQVPGPELVDGGTLRDWQQARRRLRQVIELLIVVADGLATAAPRVSCTATSSPINLITKSGYAKLADFGLAKLHEAATETRLPRHDRDAHARRRHRRNRRVHSPEKALGQPLDAERHFSFGVVLHERWPDSARSAGASDLDLARHLHGPHRPLPNDVPLPLRMVVEKALEKDPADASSRWREMVVDLRRMVRHDADRTAASDESWFRARTAWGAAAGMTRRSGVCGGAGRVFRGQQPAEPARSQYTSSPTRGLRHTRRPSRRTAAC